MPFLHWGKAIGPLFGGILIELSSYRILFVVCAVAVFVTLAIVFIVVKANQSRTVHY